MIKTDFNLSNREVKGWGGVIHDPRLGDMPAMDDGDIIPIGFDNGSSWPDHTECTSDNPSWANAQEAFTATWDAPDTSSAWGGGDDGGYDGGDGGGDCGGDGGGDGGGGD